MARLLQAVSHRQGKKARHAVSLQVTDPLIEAGLKDQIYPYYHDFS